MGKTVTKSFIGGKLTAKDNIDWIILLMKTQGFVCPCPGAIYMHITIFIKHLCSEITWPIKAKFSVEPLWEVGEKVYINGTVT